MTEHNVREAGLERLASRLVEEGVLSSDWLPTFRTVRRELFVPPVIWPGQAKGTGQQDAVDLSTDPDAWYAAVYSDVSLTTQWDDKPRGGTTKGSIPTCSNSQPSMVFSMLASLDLQPGYRVIEVGTGTGWNAALLSERLGSDNVVTVEVDPENAASAREHIEAAGYWPTMVVGDGAQGFRDGAPYDRALVTASLGEIPPELVRQVVTGGVLVAPFHTTYGGGAVARLTKQEDGTAHGAFVGSAAFMRLRQHRTLRKHVREYMGGQEWPADAVRTTTALSPEDVGDWLPMFAIGLQTKGMFPWAEYYDDGQYTLWLRDEAVTSWATVDYVPGAEAFVVYQSGPRELWSEAEAAYRWWHGYGRPGFDRLGLTVNAESRSHFAWVDAPDHPLPVVG